jgi:hypothetical protein
MKGTNVAIVAMLLSAVFLVFNLSFSTSEGIIQSVSPPPITAPWLLYTIFLPIFLILVGIVAVTTKSKIPKVLAGGYLLIYTAAVVLAAVFVPQVARPATTFIGVSLRFQFPLYYDVSSLPIYLLIAAAGIVLLYSGVRKSRKDPSPSVLSGAA